MDIFKFENTHLNSMTDNNYFNKEDEIKTILTEKVPNFLEEKSFSSSIFLYSEFLDFLGKKRKREEKIEQKDVVKFINPKIANESLEINIKEENENYYGLEIFNNNQQHFYYNFYKNPKIGIPINNNKIIEIAFINSNSEFTKLKNKYNSYKISYIQEVEDFDILFSNKNIIINEEKNNNNINLKENKKTMEVLEKGKLLFDLGINSYFLIFKKYFYNYIPEKNITFEKVFNKINENQFQISPLLISQKYFDYIFVPLNLRINYYYFNTKERQNFIQFLNKYMAHFNSIIGISGPKGIGQSASLIYWSSLRLYRVFYINMIIFNMYNVENMVNCLLF